MLDKLNIFGKLYVALSAVEGFKRGGIFWAVVYGIIGYVWMLLLYPVGTLVGLGLVYCCLKLFGGP